MNDSKYCLSRALTLMNVPFTQSGLNNFLSTTKNVNSMLALSDFFDSYQIENTAGEFENKNEIINYNEQHISQLTHDNSAYFVIVEAITNNTITYYNEGKKTNESLEEYLKKWSGYVLFFKKTTQSAEPNYNENKKKEFLKTSKIIYYSFFSVLALTIIIYSCFPLIFSFAFNSLIFLKITGIVVSILLLSYKYGSNNSFINGICNIGKKGSCGNILNSKAANVFSFLSWSEVGLFYFGSTFLTFLAIEFFQLQAGYYLLIGLNILAVPYSFYSVYYQQKVAKSWCVLCLSVQGLLWLEFFVGISLWKSFSFQHMLIPSLMLLLLGITVVSIWYLLKPLLEANVTIPKTKNQLKKFKEDISIFNFMLQNEKEITIPAQANIMRFGSNHPKVHVTIFTSPLCIHCSKAHLILDKLLLQYPNQFAYSQIFTIVNDDLDERKQLAAHMLQLKKEKDEEYAHAAISDWYKDDEKNKNNWMKKYPVNGNALSENQELINFHISIAQHYSVDGTPKLTVNGRFLPTNYSVEDLEYIIPNLLK